MQYNDKFIREYQEQSYLKFLLEPSLLRTLLVNYKSRYEQDKSVDGTLILFQESLNNYVVKKIKTNPEFIKTKEFKNYIDHLKETMNLNTGYFFQNCFFHCFTKEELIQMLGIEFYQKINQNAKEKINSVKVINEKIAKNEQITQWELNRICDVYAFNRDPNNQHHKKLIEYIFNNLTNPNSKLECSEYVLDAILSFIPKSYPNENGFNSIDCRVIADDKNVKGPGISHGNLQQALMNRGLFKHTNFKSIADIDKTYVKKGTDFTFLMIVAYHEFSHQYQSYMSKKDTFNSEGYMMLKRGILDSELKDYSENHDSDDIEVDATEKGWIACQTFYSNFVHNNQLREELCKKSLLNSRGTANRRFEYEKMDTSTKTYSKTSFYDITKLSDIIYKKPQYIQKFPMLKTFYDEKGNLSLDFLKIDNICNNQIGADYLAYLCINFPRKVSNYLNNLSESGLVAALTNMDYCFSKYRKPIIYSDYNDRNNLDGEYKKPEKTQDVIDLKNYQTLLKLYGSMKLILSTGELSSKKSYLDLIERSMEFAKKQYEKNSPMPGPKK